LAPRWGDVDLDVGKVRVERSIEHTASGLRFFLTISRRLGHASPTITLNVYGHLFANSDNRAADVVEAAFGKALSIDRVKREHIRERHRHKPRPFRRQSGDNFAKSGLKRIAN